MPTPPKDSADPVPPPAPALAEIRYSLPALLAELKEETRSSSTAMEKLHQAEIGKLFTARPKRRVKKP
jgi:hypothetical protein